MAGVTVMLPLMLPEELELKLKLHCQGQIVHWQFLHAGDYHWLLLSSEGYYLFLKHKL